MSAVAEMKPVKGVEVGRNEVMVYGKVVGVRSATTKEKQKLWFTLVRLPASGDEFASPPTVEVISSGRVGAVGEVVSQRCRLGGYGRRFNTKPDGDGVVEQVQTADVRLYAIE